MLLADCGGVAGGDSPYEFLRTNAILRGEVQMGVVAHNLGRSELEFGAESIRELGSDTQVPFVSANARDADGRPLAPAMRTVQVGDQQICFIGVVSPDYATTEVQIESPRAAILDVLNGMTERPDRVVVLAYLPHDQLRALAAELPEVDAIVGGPTGQSIVPTQVGPVTLAAATNKGKFLVELAMDGSTTSRMTGQVVEMNEELSDDPGQLENLSWFRERLADRDFTALESGFVSASSNSLPESWKVSGSDSCAACHDKDCVTWEASTHAHAWTTLANDKSHVDSYCQQCHTTGFGQPGGFVSAKRSGNRVHVGCESCHGPSHEHVASEGSSPTPFRAADQCVRCHDRENSPEFNYSEYWSKVQHGSGEEIE